MAATGSEVPSVTVGLAAPVESKVTESPETKPSTTPLFSQLWELERSQDPEVPLQTTDDGERVTGTVRVTAPEAAEIEQGVPGGTETERLEAFQVRVPE